MTLLHRRVLRFLVALSVSAGMSAPAAALAAGNDNNSETTFGIQPSGPTKVDNRGYFTYTATPGGHIADYAAITNYSLHPITLSVYATDATNTPTGGFALLPTTATPHDVGTWIQLPANLHSLTVKARASAIIPFHVVVPPKATPGDHVGGIAVVLTSYATSKTGQRFRLFQTVGSRLFVRVSGPLRPRLSIEQLRASYRGRTNPFAEGSASVTYVVRNTGNVAIGAISQVSVSGLFGAVHATPQHVPLLLPGGFATERIVVHGVLPAMLLKATVRLHMLTLPGAAVPPAGPFTASTHFWAIPGVLVAALVLLAALAAAYLYRRRRRRKPDEQERPAAGRHRLPAPV